MPGHFGPAIDGDFAVLGVQPHHHVPGKRGAGVVQKTGRLHRRRADDDVADAGIEIFFDGIEIADAAAQLDRQLIADRGDNRLDRRAILRLARGGAIQIHHMQTARAQIQPAFSGSAGVV